MAVLWMESVLWIEMLWNWYELGSFIGLIHSYFSPSAVELGIIGKSVSPLPPIQSDVNTEPSIMDKTEAEVSLSGSQHFSWMPSAFILSSCFVNSYQVLQLDMLASTCSSVKWEVKYKEIIEMKSCTQL